LIDVLGIFTDLVIEEVDLRYSTIAGSGAEVSWLVVLPVQKVGPVPEHPA
jgi:hypothetical protein